MSVQKNESIVFYEVLKEGFLRNLFVALLVGPAELIFELLNVEDLVVFTQDILDQLLLIHVSCLIMNLHASEIHGHARAGGVINEPVRVFILVDKLRSDKAWWVVGRGAMRIRILLLLVMILFENAANSATEWAVFSTSVLLFFQALCDVDFIRLCQSGQGRVNDFVDFE